VTRPTYAVVPSMGRDCLKDCLRSLLGQVTTLFLIKTEDFTPDLSGIPGTDRIAFISDLHRPRNISRWWNVGLNAAEQGARAFRQPEWNVLIVNDDVIACPQLTGTLNQAMRDRVIVGDTQGQAAQALRECDPVLAYPDNFRGDRCTFHRTPGAVDLTTRISGWCFMLRGETGIRTDEQFQWFYGDDDLDWTCRARGGALMVPGCAVEHLHPNELTAASAELSARTHIDRQLFTDKWQTLPH
jgi:hypothetical protein